MADQDIDTVCSLVPNGYKTMDSDDESETNSLHIESAQDIMLPFTTHLPDFLSSLETVTVTLGLDGCTPDTDSNLAHVDSNAIRAEPCMQADQTKTNPPPVTPTKSPDEPLFDPITPTANLKILMSAASPEIRNMEKRQKSKALFAAIVEAASEQSIELQQNLEFEVDVEGNSQGEEYVEDMEKPANRKAKSLGLLCQRFLSKYPDYPVDGRPMEISLDAISKELSVERRRIYDIVNVLESVEMVQRQAKNKYLWHGKMYLMHTLVKLKCLGERNDYGSQMEHLKKVQVDKEFQEVNIGGGRSKKQPLKDFTNTAGQGSMGGKRLLEDDPNSRRDKSLGVMSQKFIMLFLVSKNQVVTLDIAARVLIGDINYEILENSKFKTKVRRLYDIANILTSLQMIKKVHIHERRGRKPAFRWIGPNPDISDIDLSQFDLDSKPVIRHSHFPPPLVTSSAPGSTSTTHPIPIRPKSRKRAAAFTRHASLNVIRKVISESSGRPCSSAPSSPVKSKDHVTISEDKIVKFKQEFDHLRTRYPDCVSELFAACNIEQELLLKECQQKQLMLKNTDPSGTSTDSAEISHPIEVSDQLQAARKVLNMGDKSHTNSAALNYLLTATVDPLHCTLQDAGQTRKSKRTIKQPVKEGYEYQPVKKRSKVELQAMAAVQKYNNLSGQKPLITLMQRVKKENLTERVMSELISNKQNVLASYEELPADLAMLQKSVGMIVPACSVALEKDQTGSAFVTVTSNKTSSEHDHGSGVVSSKSTEIQKPATKFNRKQLPENGESSSAERKPNLPLIRNPTRTICMSQEYVKSLLCNEQLDETIKGVSDRESAEAAHSVDGNNMFVSTKPVNPAALNNDDDSRTYQNQSSVKVVQKSPSIVSRNSLAVFSTPNSPPLEVLSQGDSTSRESLSSQAEGNSQSSSLHIPLSPYLQLCQGSSRGVSPHLGRCSSLGSVGELERIFGTDSQVSAQCRSKSVSPSLLIVQGGSQSPPSEIVRHNQPIIRSGNSPISVARPSPNLEKGVPQTLMQTCVMTTAPVRLGIPMPVKQVTLVPPVNQSPGGHFMPISSILPPHTAGSVTVPSALSIPVPSCITMHAATSTTCIPRPLNSTATPTTHIAQPPHTTVPCMTTAIPTTHIPRPPYTTMPAGLITPTTNLQNASTNNINYYRTPTSLSLGTIQPKAFLSSQSINMPTPYVLSGVGGAIGQLQPVSRRLTLSMPPFSQN